MKRIFTLILLSVLLFYSNIFSQDVNENTATFFDDNKKTTFRTNLITVTGEIEQPVIINPDTLTLHSFPFKEAKRNGTKKRFIGSYFASGYSLYDILKNVKLKKRNEKEFHPLVDLFIIIENKKGERTVFSWGEIFYSRHNFSTIITKSIVPINPSKGKMKWQVPKESRLVCAYDLTNERFLSNPSKITIGTYHGEYSKERQENIYSPSITILKNEQTYSISEIPADIKSKKLELVGYGHGKGFKGIKDIEGYCFGKVLSNVLEFSNDEIGNSLMIFSAKDGYRVAFSLSEIINRNDFEGMLLMDYGESESNGKFTSFVPSDFFVDRNVRAVERIEILSTDRLLSR